MPDEVKADSPLSPFERFERFMKVLVAVPKKEIDRKLAYYERDKRNRRRKAVAKAPRTA